MRTHALDAQRITRAEIRHAHDLIRNSIGFLLELIARLVDRELRLEQVVLKLALCGLIAEMRLSSQCGSLRATGGQPTAG